MGVIGGDNQMATGFELGRLIAEREWILLTGGQLLPRAAVELRGEVKDASMLGAAEAAPSKARLIGILPAEQWPEARWDYAEGSRRFFLHTGLPHYVRNVINGRTPDVIVALGGSRGTLSEIAFAKACGRPLLFFEGSLKRLRQRFRDYFGQPCEANEDRRKYFDQPLKVYPKAAGAANDAVGLISLLDQMLSAASEVGDLAAALSAIIGGCDWRSELTGFPGLPGDSASKRRFEAIVRAISQ